MGRCPVDVRRHRPDGGPEEQPDQADSEGQGSGPGREVLPASHQRGAAAGIVPETGFHHALACKRQDYARYAEGTACGGVPACRVSIENEGRSSGGDAGQRENPPDAGIGKDGAAPEDAGPCHAGACGPAVEAGMSGSACTVGPAEARSGRIQEPSGDRPSLADAVSRDSVSRGEESEEVSVTVRTGMLLESGEPFG